LGGLHPPSLLQPCNGAATSGVSISQVVHSGAVTFCDLDVYWLRPRPVACHVGRLDRASARLEIREAVQPCTTRGEFRPFRATRSPYRTMSLGVWLHARTGNRGKGARARGSDMVSARDRDGKGRGWVAGPYLRDEGSEEGKRRRLQSGRRRKVTMRCALTRAVCPAQGCTSHWPAFEFCTPCNPLFL
jgi:hypothetical protein